MRAPTVVFFTFRFDPRLAAWFRDEVDGRAWDGASALYLASIFEPGNPFGESAWRRVHGGLWDVGPHALSAVLPALGKVERVAAVRGPRDEVHLALAHESGAASSAALSLTAPAGVNEVVFWGAEGFVRQARNRRRGRGRRLRRGDRRPTRGRDDLRCPLRPRGRPRSVRGRGRAHDVTRNTSRRLFPTLSGSRATCEDRSV